MLLLCGLLTAVVQGFKYSSLTNFHISCAVYAELSSISPNIGLPSNLFLKRFSTDLSITSSTVELS